MNNPFKAFFSDSNEVNEKTVIGVLCLGLAIAGYFMSSIPMDKFYAMLGMSAVCFGLSALTGLKK